MAPVDRTWRFVKSCFVPANTDLDCALALHFDILWHEPDMALRRRQEEAQAELLEA